MGAFAVCLGSTTWFCSACKSKATVGESDLDPRNLTSFPPLMLNCASIGAFHDDFCSNLCREPGVRPLLRTTNILASLSGFSISIKGEKSNSCCRTLSLQIVCVVSMHSSMISHRTYSGRTSLTSFSDHPLQKRASLLLSARLPPMVGVTVTLFFR